MAFRIAARTIVQLGAELISSDAISFYELIKNAFDAGSPRVDIDIVVRIEHQTYMFSRDKIVSEQLKNRIRRAEEGTLSKMRSSVLPQIDRSAPEVDELEEEISNADSWSKLIDTLDEANYIKIDDSGTGMSLKDLEDIFLTVGTRSRLKEREKLRRRFAGQERGKEGFRPILGEKGIGRLSAMRLGSRLRVITSQKGEERWNVLEIDWNLFSKESEELVGDIDIRPRVGGKKDDRDESGTLMWIYGLNANWNETRLKKIAAEEFSKLTDPFTPRLRYPISLRFNGEPVRIPRFEKILFESAHAHVKAKYIIEDGNPNLAGKVNYSMRIREKTFSLDLVDLQGITSGLSQESLKSLGPFSLEFYWFNRQALKAIDGIGDRRRVQELVGNWAGGLMVFRDGFRVNPYGSPDDDWLDLDRRALASGGYKVNRRQIVGKVDISSLENSSLMDQTNREGLRDCEEKEVLIKLLKHVLEVQFRAFLNNVDAEVQARIPVTFEDLEDRVGTEEQRIRRSLKLLRMKYPQVKKDKEIFISIEDSIEKIRRLMGEAQELADSFESGQAKLLNLAGLGLMVEIVAHELNRATQHALGILGTRDRVKEKREMADLFSTLEAQLKTLQKRLRILDPMSTAGRQVKEKFDLIGWVEEILASHEAQFERHRIKYTIEVKPGRKATGFQVKMVKGMIAHIFENILINSVYWLKQKRITEKGFSPEISVTIDTKEREIRITDNGPGVPIERKEEIFQPFVTTKPPGEGKGLGLYISREIAKYHNAKLYMSDDPSISEDRLNTFVFRLEEEEE